MSMKVLIHVIILAFTTQQSLQSCTWYGECNKENGKSQNCLAKNSDPLPFKNETRIFEILNAKCPYFLKKYSGKKFCCDDDQIDTMVQSMNYAAGIFARCPTCMANLNQHICLMTCAPDQSEFLKAVDLGANEEGEKYIKEVNFYVSKEYLEKTFDSCKEVTVPSTGGKAIDITCGQWGADEQCTAEKWFEFFGDDKQNLMAPFHIRYISSSEDGYKAVDIKAIPCNESYESSVKCSCSDCKASCTIPFQYHSPRSPFLIGNADGVMVIMIIVFCVLSQVIILFFIKHNTGKTTVPPTRQHHFNFGRRTKKCFDGCRSSIRKNLENVFSQWGIFCARNSVLVLVISLCVISIFMYGLTKLEISTNLTEIWASPTSKTRLEKTYFDTRFAPFYRTNQIFLKPVGLKPFNWTFSNDVQYEFGPVFHCDFLEEIYKLQTSIEKLKTDENIGLEEICFAPMKNEFFDGQSIEYCVVQSVWGYVQNDIKLCKENPDVLYSQFHRCLRNNYDPSCLAPYGGPIFSPLAVGGYRGINQKNDYLLATGLSLTFLVNNPINKTVLEKVLKWETMFIDFLKEWTHSIKPEFIEVAFSAERSIQDEFERESKSEMITIIISYLVMFVYITVALGKVQRLSSLLLDTKFILGIGGIIIVLASVFASFGIFAYLGVATTLLTIEVIPFLILAIGVDNVFILVHTYQEIQLTSEGTIEENIGLALKKKGPSILLTSVSEAACFFIGTLSDMPAIKIFAEYSSVAIILNFLLQCSCFISILALDSKRQKKNLADVFCCIQVEKTEINKENISFMQLVFKNYYGPFILKPRIKICVILVFFFWLCASISCIPHIDKGLDQKQTMPEDSYVIDYFKFMDDLLSVGPPVYFVVKSGLNFTRKEDVNAICGSVGCDTDSLVTYLTRASQMSNVSYLAKSPSSWVDDYFDWLLNSKVCCKEFRENGSFCPHQNDECETCTVNISNFRPRAEDFNKYLPYFLNDNPDVTCSKGGHAAYAGGVNFEIGTEGDFQVKDNYFMTYHTPLKTSYDFYMALENAQNIANYLSDALTLKLNQTVEIFPYSVFYVYYEQYLKIVKDSFFSLSSTLLAVFCVSFIFTGFDFLSSGLVSFAVTSILINMLGMLYWWNISLNAVSLVNLIISVGIGVEFCSHIMHAYRTSSEPNGTSKAQHALSSMGISVFSGITLTKFLGIFVLAFAQTLMLRNFYFKMYLGIIIIGVTHGLILMPVLLSYFD